MVCIINKLFLQITGIPDLKKTGKEIANDCSVPCIFNIPEPGQMKL
jgi:hypothetical protein